MEKQEVGELLHLLHAARRSGVPAQIMDSMIVEEKPGGMSDAAKRCKNLSESSDSDWDATVGKSSDDPTVDDKVRFETVDGAVVAKALKTEKSGGASSKETPDASHIKHVDKSVRLPNGVKSFQDWGNTLVKMDKYAKNRWSFAELVAFAETDKKAMSYVTWLIGTLYASPPVLDPANQAENFGAFAHACGLKPKSKGYQRETK